VSADGSSVTFNSSRKLDTLDENDFLITADTAMNMIWAEN
jgi:hypothetical protein